MSQTASHTSTRRNPFCLPRLICLRVPCQRVSESAEKNDVDDSGRAEHSWYSLHTAGFGDGPFRTASGSIVVRCEHARKPLRGPPFPSTPSFIHSLASVAFERVQREVRRDQRVVRGSARERPVCVPSRPRRRCRTRRAFSDVVGGRLEDDVHDADGQLVVRVVRVDAVDELGVLTHRRIVDVAARREPTQFLRRRSHLRAHVVRRTAGAWGGRRSPAFGRSRRWLVRVDSVPASDEARAALRWRARQSRGAARRGSRCSMVGTCASEARGWRRCAWLRDVGQLR